MCFRLTRLGTVIEARGEVRHSLPGAGIGVEFIEVSDQARGAMAEELRLASGESD